MCNIVFDNYTIEQYKSDLDKYGIYVVWNSLLEHCLHGTSCSLLNTENFGELYEIGLAHTNKIAKKEMGKYFTPQDVADLMSDWFAGLKGKNICDVCCGTGNLILSYLRHIGKKKTITLLKNKRLFLYDVDSLALKICLYSIGILYGKEYMSNVNVIQGDFLNRNISLPDNCKVISNPPYFKIKNIAEDWICTDVLQYSKEFYSAIMEKIIDQSDASVVITPYSFIGGEKFYSLRKKLNQHNGFIVSFDNVPGSIFSGKKHGIFNTNNTNSVRAAITVVENKSNRNGFKISPLIRFKNTEREELLKTSILNQYIPNVYQLVDDQNKAYYKCFTSLIPLREKWERDSNQHLKDIISNAKTKYSLCIPNSCRYFTVAAVKDLHRTGKNTLCFNNETDRNLSYCLLNSSFAYWHWRMYDGGITYPVALLLNIPIFFDRIPIQEKNKLNQIAKEMQSVENKYLAYKKNAGEMQENVKFPDKYRNQINSILLQCLDSTCLDVSIFNIIHANAAFADSANNKKGETFND